VELEGKVAMVTGASGGIGSAIAPALAGEGAAVALTYLHNGQRAEERASRIKGKGGSALILCMDVRDRQTVRRAVAECEARLGGLDILVNNAGINRPADFDQVSDEDWDQVLVVNLKGPFICAQECLPLLARRGGGAIINIGSVSGQYGGPRTVHYAASKAGLISLGQVIARFAARYNVRCNTVAAGLIESKMASSAMGSSTVGKKAAEILLGRLGTAEEVAKVVVFLASDASSYITAQTLNVNGGLYF